MKIAIGLLLIYFSLWWLITRIGLQLYTAALVIYHLPRGDERFRDHEWREHTIQVIRRRVRYSTGILHPAVYWPEVIVLPVWPLWVCSVFRATRIATERHFGPSSNH